MESLNWKKWSCGYEATGQSGRYYSILRHGSQFRSDCSTGKEVVSSLKAVKAECERIELLAIALIREDREKSR